MSEAGFRHTQAHAPLYLLIFHCGLSRYRKAFQTHLSQFDVHGDWKRAWSDTILRLDEDRFNKDIVLFLERKVKVVKAR